MNLFFCENIENNRGTFSPEESAHCIRVLRYRKGDEINVTDGKGSIFTAVVKTEDNSGCIFEVTGVVESIKKRDYRLHIGISPVKNMGRFEWFLEKVTEIGIDVITPVICTRTERPGINSERMRKILISSVKQALVPVLPVLEEAMDFKNFVLEIRKRYGDPGTLNSNSLLKLIGYCNEKHRLPLSHLYKAGSDVVFLIGPEGDFTSDEVTFSMDNGFIAVTLGDTRLRTETAGIVACTAISILNS